MPEREKPLNVKIIYEWGTIFYVKHDELQRKRMLTFIEVNENGILFGLSCGDERDTFYLNEISETEDTSYQTVKKEDDND